MCLLSLWTQTLYREDVGAGGLIRGKKTSLISKLEWWSQHYIAIPAQ